MGLRESQVSVNFSAISQQSVKMSAISYKKLLQVSDLSYRSKNASFLR